MHDSQAITMEPEAHNPALLHHFADAQQQKNAASLGMWLFLVTEIMFFGGMFCGHPHGRAVHCIQRESAPCMTSRALVRPLLRALFE